MYVRQQVGQLVRHSVGLSVCRPVGPPLSRSVVPSIVGQFISSSAFLHIFVMSDSPPLPPELQPLNVSMCQPTNPPLPLSIDLLNAQSLDRLFVRILSICLSDHVSVSPLTFHSVRRPVSQPVSPSVYQSVSRSILPSVIPPVTDCCSRPTAKYHLCMSFVNLLPNFNLAVRQY